MLYVVPFIASALMFLFIFCAVRAIRDYSGSWVVFSLLAGPHAWCRFLDFVLCNRGIKILSLCSD